MRKRTNISDDKVEMPQHEFEMLIRDIKKTRIVDLMNGIEACIKEAYEWGYKQGLLDNR